MQGRDAPPAGSRGTAAEPGGIGGQGAVRGADEGESLPEEREESLSINRSVSSQGVVPMGKEG